MSGCKGDLNYFCFVCGHRLFAGTRHGAFSSDFERQYEKYFGFKVIKNVDYAPKEICKTCYNSLNGWWNQTKKELSFGVPMIWTDPGQHNTFNCYACANFRINYTRKSPKLKTYIGVQSAQLPLQHSAFVPVPAPPSPTSFSSYSQPTVTESRFEGVQSAYAPADENSLLPVPVSQNLLDKMVAELGLSQRKAELLACYLKKGNNLEDNVKVTGYRSRQSEFQKFFTANNTNEFAFCNDIYGLMSAMDIKYNCDEWRIFIDSSKTSLKAILLHKLNKKSAVPIAYGVSMQETYESLQNILNLVQYDQHKWKVCCDFKVVALLCGMQTGYTKNMCFLCLWDTRFKGNQYDSHHWINREAYELNKGNVVRKPLIPNDRVLLPPLHLTLGIIKSFIKTVAMRDEVLNCLQQIFPKLSVAKLKAGVLNGPDIRNLKKKANFDNVLIGDEKIAWDAIKKVMESLLGKRRSRNYKVDVETMLSAFSSIGVNMSLKIHLLHHHLELLASQLSSESDEHGERFHQVALPMEMRYKGKKLNALLAEICWWSHKMHDNNSEDEVGSDCDDPVVPKRLKQ